MSGPSQSTQRIALVTAAQSLSRLGLNSGTSGNISVRNGQGILITPSAIPYELLTPELIAHMPLNGAGTWAGPKRPSSEWRFHLDIHNARSDINAIVHTHAPYATALAMARQEIPPCHYMVTRFGGDNVRCAPYALFGTAELSALAVTALENRSACLLANHGLIATGPTLKAAMACATELETLAHQYILSLTIGGPILLTPEQIIEAQTQFTTAYRPNT